MTVLEREQEEPGGSAGRDRPAGLHEGDVPEQAFAQLLLAARDIAQSALDHGPPPWTFHKYRVLVAAIDSMISGLPGAVDPLYAGDDATDRSTASLPVR